MMTYVLLALVLALLCLIVFFETGNELMAPAVIVVLSLLFATLLAALGTISWNSLELSSLSIGLIVIGVVMFWIGSMFGRRLFPALRKSPNPIEKWGVSLKSGIGKYQFLVFVGLMACAVHLFEAFGIAAASGAPTGSVLEVLSWVRLNAESASGQSFQVGFSFFDRLLQKISAAIGYLGIVACIFHFRAKNRKYLHLSIAMVLCYALPCLADGSRMEVFSLLVAFLYGSFILAVRDGRRMKGFSVSINYIGIFLVVIAVGGLAFFYLATILRGLSADTSFIDYMSFYFGCGVPGLEGILSDGSIQANQNSAFVFYSQLELLRKLGLTATLPEIGPYWLNMNGYMCNVFTFQFTYFAGFGLVGGMVLPCLSGFIYTTFYERMFRDTLHPAALASFLLVGSQLFDVARAAKLFTTFINSTAILKILAILIIGAWLFSSKSDHRMTIPLHIAAPIQPFGRRTFGTRAHADSSNGAAEFNNKVSHAFTDCASGELSFRIRSGCGAGGMLQSASGSCRLLIRESGD